MLRQKCIKTLFIINMLLALGFTDPIAVHSGIAFSIKNTCDVASEFRRIVSESLVDGCIICLPFGKTFAILPT